MKTAKKFILSILVLLLGSSLAFAQYGYGYGNPYSYGRNRSIVPQGPDEPVKEAKPQTADEIVAAEMPRITEVLDLNEFEQAVVTSILTRSVQQSIELQILDPGPEKLREGMEKIQHNQREELKAGLPEDKYNTLVDLQDNGYKNIKKKKKKKKDKKTKS
jgi:hypothetical protein